MEKGIVWYRRERSKLLAKGGEKSLNILETLSSNRETREVTMGEDFSLKTDFITPTSGSSVLCWDTMWIKNQNPDDKLNCHGEIGMVIRAADPMDLDVTGLPLGTRAKDCFVVVFPSTKRQSVVHSQWLRVVEAEA